MHLTIKCSTDTIELDLDDNTLLTELQDILYKQFHIAPQHQKLLLKGKSILANSTPTSIISYSSLTNGSKLFLCGAKESDITALTKHEAYIQHKASVIASRQPTKVRSTATSSSTRFHLINPFPAAPSTPHFDLRRAFLQRLSTDPAVLHLMGQKDRDWVVLELGELHPHTQPTLLGLNTNNNGGMTNTTLKIELRILTDDLSGLRSYNGVRRVLLHELAHIRHPNHELPFKELDSQLAKELAAFYSDPARRGNRLGGEILDEYNPAEMAAVGNAMLSGKCEVEAPIGMPLAGGERLGGGSASNAALSPRERIARAAEQRNAKR